MKQQAWDLHTERPWRNRNMELTCRASRRGCLRQSTRTTWAFLFLLVAIPSSASTPADDLRVAQTAFVDHLPDIVRNRVEAIFSARNVDATLLQAAFELLMAQLDRDNNLDAMHARLTSPPRPLQREKDLPWFRYWLARLEFRQERYLEALSRIEGLEKEVQDPESRMRMAHLEIRCHWALNQADRVWTLFESLDGALESPDLLLDNALDWSWLLYIRGNYPDCIERLAPRLSDADPTDPRVVRGLFLLADAFSAQDQHEAALAILDRLINAPVSPRDHGEAWMRIARLRAETMPDAAETAARNALRLLADTALEGDALLALANLVIRTPGRRTEGIELLRERIRRLPPNSHEAEVLQLRIADVLRQSGDAAAAVDAYQAFLQMFPNSGQRSRVYWGYGWALLDLKQFEASSEAFRQSHSLASDRQLGLQALYKSADALFAASRYMAAAEIYRRVQEDSQDRILAARAGLQTAESFFRADEVKEARHILDAVRRNYADLGDGTEAALRLGRILDQIGEVDRAVTLFSDLLERDDLHSNDRARARVGRGRVFYRAFRFDHALQNFEEVIADAPSDATIAEEAMYYRILCLYWMRRDSEALADAEMFLKNRPTARFAANILFWMGRHAYNRGQHDDARTRFEQFADTWPDHPWNPVALLWASRAAFAAAAFGDTLAFANRLAMDFPDSDQVPEARFLQGEALTMHARFEEAILAYDTVITHYPLSDWVTPAWGRKGDCLFTLGKDAPERYEESLHAYRVVTQREDASLEAVLQAEFKYGRSLEKLHRYDEALDQYYTAVLDRYVKAREEGAWHNDASKAWFARSVFQASQLLESQQNWNAAVRLLRRIEQEGVPGREEALERIARIEREQRWGFPRNPFP